MDSMVLRVTTPSGTAVLSPDRTYVIGRSRNADVVVEDSKVSRQHVELVPGPDGWTARDTSTNGMWSEGTRKGSVEVDGETRLRLGGSNGPEIVLTAPRPAPRRPSPPPEPDVSAAETVLAGQGRVPAAGQPGAVPPGTVPRARGAEPVGAAATPAPSAGQAAPATAGSWLRMLPTMVWFAAVGFTLGALLALS